MTEPKVLSLFWEGFELQEVTDLDDTSLQLRLRPQRDQLPRCGDCGRQRLYREVIEPDRTELCRLIMDEFSLQDIVMRPWSPAPIRNACCG